jgi:hypothetical protein
MAGLLALVGVVIGFAASDYAAKRRDAALFALLSTYPVNTAAPTTAELSTSR